MTAPPTPAPALPGRPPPALSLAGLSDRLERHRQDLTLFWLEPGAPAGPATPSPEPPT